MGIVLFASRGEADTDGTNREKYLASLQQLIAQTRENAGYNLNWCIAGFPMHGAITIIRKWNP